MKVQIRIYNVGCHFGTEAELVDLQGNVVWTGPTVPYQFDTAARNSAEREAERQGYTIVETREDA